MRDALRRTAALAGDGGLEEGRHRQSCRFVGRSARLADEQDTKDGAEQLPAALARVPCERGRVGDLVQHPCRAGLGTPRHQLRAPMYACTPNAAVVRWPRRPRRSVTQRNTLGDA